MKFISNVFMVTGIMIGMPIIFYLIFHGTRMDRLPDIEDVESGYTIVNGSEYDLDQYLIGVLPTEMNLDSEYEAIKAQAVIARTSILYQLKGKKQMDGNKLEEGYITQEKLKEQNNLAAMCVVWYIWCKTIYKQPDKRCICSKTGNGIFTDMLYYFFWNGPV